MKLNKVELTKKLVNLVSLEDLSAVVDYNKAYTLYKSLEDTSAVVEDTSAVVETSKDTKKDTKKASKKDTSKDTSKDTKKASKGVNWTPCNTFDLDKWHKLLKWVLEHQNEYHKGNKVYLNKNNNIIVTNKVKNTKKAYNLPNGKTYKCNPLYAVYYGYETLENVMNTRYSK